MTATRTTVEIERSTAEFALRWLLAERNRLAEMLTDFEQYEKDLFESERQTFFAAVADLRRALGKEGA